MKIKMAVLLMVTMVMVMASGCSALKGLVNNAMDGGHGVLTNGAAVATAPLK